MKASGNLIYAVKRKFCEISSQVHRLRPQLALKPRSVRPDSFQYCIKKIKKTRDEPSLFLKDQGSLRITANAFGVIPSTTDHKCFAVNIYELCVCYYLKVTQLNDVLFPPRMKKDVECLYETFILREVFTWKFPSRVVILSLCLEPG